MSTEVVGNFESAEENRNLLLDLVDDLSQYGELGDVRIQTNLNVFGYCFSQKILPLEEY